MWRWQ
jgi:hypothetical protein